MGGERLEAEWRHLVVPVLPVLTTYWVEVRIKLLVWCASVCTAVSELRALDSSLISLAGLNPGGRSHTHEKGVRFKSKSETPVTIFSIPTSGRKHRHLA